MVPWAHDFCAQKSRRNHGNNRCGNLKILNKADLADPKVTQAWLNHFNAQPNTKAVALSCKKPGDAKKVPKQCRPLAPHRGTHIKPLRMMIMGIPNVGKSTLMNALLNRRAAKVGDEPAVTKSQQRFELDPTMTITDTPGMMWPKIAHDADGFMLAASHAIGRNAVIDEDVAEFLGNVLIKQYPNLIAERYKLEKMQLDVNAMDGIDLLEAIAKRRSYKRRDGVGRVSLESPTSRAEMLAEKNT